MKLLVIGGTRFLGRYIVESALARGHQVTLFNRGQSAPELFPQVEQIHGDRDGDLALLAGRSWDCVIDTCGFVPRIVRASAEALAEAAERYIFISSISVYADMSHPGIDEDAPVATLEDETVEEITNDTYGALKALSEQAAEKAMPGRVLVIRPGLIVGPHDKSDRFTYWPYRVAQGGEMLAPGDPEQPTQFIDVRDLAAWTVLMAETRKTGVYNATGPDYALSTARFLEECRSATTSDTRFVWVSEDLLKKHDALFVLQPWIPAEYAGMNAANCQKALHDGLTFRPIAETVRDTLAWRGEAELRSGLKRDQEEQLLREWKAEKNL
ncbi:MAG TPA: NAD-dependent epimerase/dehydratase family protein [Ktedonosporobacter sp.]|nr:NAD-dependent epimerase/dehydratase family protein [Ktedonosporobacter sp.]